MDTPTRILSLAGVMALVVPGQGCIDFDDARASYCQLAATQKRGGLCGLAETAPFTGEAQAPGNISRFITYNKKAPLYGGSALPQEMTSAVCSPHNELWMTGRFQGEVDFGAYAVGAESERGGWDGFVAMLNPDGSLGWGRTYGGPQNEVVTRVAVAPGGDGFVTGTFRGSGDGSATDVGGGFFLPDTGSTLSFVIQMHPQKTNVSPLYPTGSTVRTINLEVLAGAPGTSVTSRAIAAGTGSVVVAGSLSGGDLAVEGTPVATSPVNGQQENLFVVGMDVGLGYRWHVAATGCDYAAADAVVLDAEDNLYLLGRGQGPACAIGDARPFSGRDPDLPFAFVARYPAGGQGLVQAQWIQVLGKADVSSPGAIAVDGAGNIVVVVNSGASRSDLVGPPGGQARTTLFKLTSAGNPLWPPLDLVSSASVQGRGLTADASGSVWLTGEFNGKTFQIGDLRPDMLPGSNAFAAQITPDAKVRWARTFNSLTPPSAVGVCVDPTTGTATVAGNFTVHLALGTTSEYVTNGSGEGFFFFNFYP